MQQRRASSPSLSMPVARRRSGTLIAIVVILDLGLAAAGAMMLVKGLAQPNPAQSAPAPKLEQHTEAATPVPTPVAVAPAAAGSAGMTAPSPAIAAPEKTVAREPKREAKPDPKHHAAAAAPAKTTNPAAPLDPYGNAEPPAADQSQEVEKQAAQSFGAFRSCLASAIQTQPIHGQIRIAFLIEADGHVDRAQAVANTTGSDALATCLAQTIGSWTFAPHSGAAASYERPFNYP